MDSDRRHRGTSSALYLQWLKDEREFVHRLRRQVLELEILQQMDAIYHQQDLVHRKANLRIWVR